MHYMTAKEARTSQRTPPKTIRMTLLNAFLDNMAVVLGFLTLEDKNNINTYIVGNIYSLFYLLPRLQINVIFSDNVCINVYLFPSPI